MQGSLIARNYADALFALAERQGEDGSVEAYDDAMRGVAAVLRSDPRIRDFLTSPRVGLEERRDAIRRTFEGHVPTPLLRFLLVTAEKRRAALLPEIASAYHERVDAFLGRARAEIRLARPADDALKSRIEQLLERQFGARIVPTYRVDATVVGGVVIRVGDRVMDGSLRRRMGQMRRRLLNARIPAATA